ncbi:glycosyltransferase family 2 protein [Paenibacillus aurantius]|uniref:Glycosyltransferase family 2 protein n=1 Tax=Paenibacillus aurantius TaxID=2918900 RepID=A0AA96RGB3_9BACL|nr:glycosyltransferase family 2 protein [Paenibacillus aurantius]WNQ12882.1 glycosyltransferase family 2 protein [Paenibacillus aurantius]
MTDLPKTSIIIPTYNGLELLIECITAIRAYTPEPYELIVVDNGSEDGTVKFCRQEKIRFVSLPVNKGFPAACNLGLRIATGDALLLLNNDIVVTHHWLENMLACLYSDETIGIVGPCSNIVSGIQQRPADYADLEQYHALAAARASDPGQWQQVERLVGLCLLFKRELMEKIGVLDERFSPGHYEDDDYCYRARRAGYRLMLAGDVSVHHHGSASFSKLDKKRLGQIVHRNRDAFIKKWDLDPRQFIQKEG